MAAMENAHALVIGIANYQQVSSLPPTVVNDALAIANLLSDRQYCAYPEGNVQLLRDEQATRDNIRAALATLAAHQPEVVFLYFSGHGGRIEGGPYAGEYLLPVDTDYSAEAAIARTAISGAEFTALLQAIPARKMVVVFDCCYAAGIAHPKDGLPKVAQPPLFKAGLPDSYYETLSAGQGWVVLASSRASEVSWVLPHAANSLFTQHMLAGLRGGAPSDDNYIRIFDLFEYVQPRVTGAHRDQHPRFKSDLEENFAVALYCGGQKGQGASHDADGFSYDAYISYVDRDPDATWVWETLVPKLEAAGLRLAVSGDVWEPGVDRVVSIERGIRRSKRTVQVLSPLYLADQIAMFENVLGQTLGIEQGRARLLPIALTPPDELHLPLHIRRMEPLNMVHPRRAGRAFERLVEALCSPPPRTIGGD
jgi:hypothetical protein